MIIGYVKGQGLALSAPVVVSDTIDYLEARFVFMTRDWDGLEVWAHWGDGSAVYDFLLDADGMITADQHLNLTAGVWTVYLTGHLYEDGAMLQRISTVPVTVSVRQSGMAGANPFPPLPATVEEQILARLKEAEDAISKLGGGGTGTDKYISGYRFEISADTGLVVLVLVYTDGNTMTVDLPEWVDTNELAAAVESALTQAKESGEFEGEPGEPGQPGADGNDGITPHIGDNGNWFIGDTDTGVQAQGPAGDDYILTDADKTEIAEEAADIVDDALADIIGEPDAAVPAVPGYMALGMTGAAVGQVARIKSVDADGRPTEWEPVEDGSERVEELSKEIEKLQGGMSTIAKTLLITILRSGVYTSDQSANINALEAALGESGGTDITETVTQIGSVLRMVGGVAVSQSGTTLSVE